MADITISGANTIGITAGDENITVTSTGFITVNGYTNAIYRDGNISRANTILNDGYISSANSGIEIYGQLNGAITNNGTINTNGHGIAVYINNETITNNGTITSINGDGILTYKNYGTIINNGTINAGVGIINEYPTNGTIINNGTINTKGIGIDTNGTLLTITNNGTINVTDDSGVYHHAIYLEDGGNGTFTNNGTSNGTIYGLELNITNNGTMNPISTYTSTMQTFTQTKNGILGVNIILAKDGKSETHSNIQVSGNIILAKGSTIHVNVTSNEIATFLDSNATTISNVLKTSGGTITNNGVAITDNLALLNFIISPDSNATILGLKAIKQSILKTTKIQHASSVYGASNVLDNIKAGKNKDIDIFINDLDALGTNSEVADAVEQTIPTIGTLLPAVSTQVINIMNNVIQARQASTRGLNSGDITFSNKNLWFKPYASHSIQKDKDGLNGFRANSYGFSIGADAEYSTGKRVGVALFYTNTSVNTNNVSQNGTLNVLNLVAYGSNPIIGDKSFLFYQIGAGIQQTKLTRQIALTSQTAKAKYNSKNFFLQVKATRDISINDKLTITPALIGTYRYYKNPSYSETGAGGLNLNVGGFSSSETLLGAQSDITYVVNENTKLLSSVAFNYNFSNNSQTVSASYQGTGGTIFNTAGIKNSPLYYKVGLGVQRKIQNNFLLNFNYALNGKGSSFLNNIVSAKLIYRF